MESVAAFEWNGGQLCRGIGGRFALEYTPVFRRENNLPHGLHRRRDQTLSAPSLIPWFFALPRFALGYLFFS